MGFGQVLVLGCVFYSRGLVSLVCSGQAIRVAKASLPQSACRRVVEKGLNSVYEEETLQQSSAHLPQPDQGILTLAFGTLRQILNAMISATRHLAPQSPGLGK